MTLKTMLRLGAITLIVVGAVHLHNTSGSTIRSFP